MSGPPSANDLLGPFVVQVIMASTLFGITLTQTGVYFQHCWGQDHPILIYAIGGLWVCGFVHILTISATLYSFTVSHFGDFAALSIPPWSFPIGAAITGLFSLAAQTYFARQVWVLGDRKRLLPACILVLALVSFAFTIASTCKGYSYENFGQFSQFEYGVLIWLCTAAAADVLITCGLVYHLRRHRNETSFNDTRSILGHVIANTIENNALTCIVACVDAVLFAKADTIGAWHVVANGQLVGLYFVSFLTSLNTRHRFASQREPVRQLSFPDLEGGVSLTTSDSKGRTSSGAALMKVLTRGSISAGMATVPRRGSFVEGGGAPNEKPGPVWEDPFALRHRTNSVQLPTPALRRQSIDLIYEDPSFEPPAKESSLSSSSTR